MDDPHSDPAAADASYELFVRRFAHHEPELRRYIRSLLPQPTDADDVLQQTAIVCGRKFGQFDPGTSVLKWACIVARFEALAYRPKMARDRLVFRKDVLEFMVDDQGGLATCLDAVTGAGIWKGRLGHGISHWASPMFADGKIYFFSREFDVTAIAYDVPLYQHLKDPSTGMSLFNLLEECARLDYDAVDPTGYFFPGYSEVPDGKFLWQFKRRAFDPGLSISGTGIRNDFAEPETHGRMEELPKVMDVVEKLAENAQQPAAIEMGLHDVPSTPLLFAPGSGLAATVLCNARDHAAFLPPDRNPVFGRAV